MVLVVVAYMNEAGLAACAASAATQDVLMLHGAKLQPV